MTMKSNEYPKKLMKKNFESDDVFSPIILTTVPNRVLTSSRFANTLNPDAKTVTAIILRLCAC